MVNLRPQGHKNGFVRVRPELPWPPPRTGTSTAEVASRTIPSKVWDLEEIKALAKQYSCGDDYAITVITNDCALDMQRHLLEKCDVADFIELLSDKCYLNSSWCMASQRPGVRVSDEARWYPCDSYCLEVIREMDDSTTIENKFYIKMCKSASGKMLLMVSMHESTN